MKKSTLMQLDITDMKADYIGAGFSETQAERMVNDLINQLFFSQNVATRENMDSLRENVDQKIDSLRENINGLHHYMLGGLALLSSVMVIGFTVLGFVVS